MHCNSMASCNSMNAPDLLLPQSLCPGCSLCLLCPFSSYLEGHLLQIFIQLPYAQRPFFKSACHPANSTYLVSFSPIFYIIFSVNSVESFCHVWLFATTWTPGFPVHHQLPELAQTHVHQWVMPSNNLILCYPLLLPPSIFPSIRVFSNESVLHIRCPKYWSFSFSISPSNEYSRLISFRIGWLDLLEVQETLKSLLQYHSSKASILWYSALFIAQLSHPYMNTGKTIALTRWTFVGKVISLLFIMLSRLAIAFLPRSKRL